jgi:hypothetical protein
MNLRKLHTVIGLTLLIPFACWIVTALVFYIKPGYDEAYELLQIKRYPLEGQLAVAADSSWQEVKYLRTILGSHLLVRTASGWQQLDPATVQQRERPSDDDIRKLVTDAFTANPARYGEITTISNDSIVTTTGIRITFGWNDLSLYQRGPDTDRIDFLYKIHYLQWTGINAVDNILGPVGLGLICVLSILGIRLAVRSRRQPTAQHHG